MKSEKQTINTIKLDFDKSIWEKIFYHSDIDTLKTIALCSKQFRSIFWQYGIKNINLNNNIESLSIQNSVLDNGSFLSALILLKYLNLFKTKIPQNAINIISTYTKLENLTLTYHANISDYSHISNLIQLTYLHLDNFEDLSSEPISNDNGVLTLTNLQSLTGYNLELNEGILKQLTNLYELHLTIYSEHDKDDALKYLSLLNKLKYFKFASIDNSYKKPITNILEYITMLTKLTVVTFENNTFDNMHLTSLLTNLKQVNFPGCKFA